MPILMGQGVRRDMCIADAILPACPAMPTLWRRSSVQSLHDSPDCGVAAAPSAPHLRAGHGARSRPRHRRRHHGLHGGGLGRADAAALPGARAPGDDLGHQQPAGAQPRSDLAGELHGSARPAGVRGCGGLVATGDQPHGSRDGPRARQYHRDERQSVPRPRRLATAGRGFSRSGPALRPRRADCGHQRSAVAHPLRRRPLDRRPTAAPQRHSLHRRGRDAARVPVSGRGGCLAAVAVGHDPAQPAGALHGSGRPPERRQHHRAGAKRGRCAVDAARGRLRQHPQQPGHRVGIAAGAAARRTAGLLPAGADGAVRRRGAAARHRHPERGIAAAHPGAVARARDGGSCRAGRLAAPAREAVDGREPGAVRRRGRAGPRCRRRWPCP